MILFLGNGFIANALTLRLDEKCIKYKVVSNDVNDESAEKIKADISLVANNDLVLEKVNTVIYFAHSSVPYSSMENILKDAEQNILTAIKLFDKFAKKNIRVIYISSGGSVYGNQLEKTTEKSLPEPISAYGLSKYTVENYLKLFHHNYRLSYDILRLSNIYGIGQKQTKPQGIICALAQAFNKREAFSIWGDGKAKKDYLYIDDVCEALLRVILSAPSNNTYNVAFGKSHSILDILSIFEKYFGYEIEYKKLKPYDFDVQNVILDNSKFAGDYDWQPKIDLETGITKTIDWVKSKR